MLKRWLLALVLLAGSVLPVVADAAPITNESHDCDNATLGVFSGNIILEPDWIPNNIDCEAGTYFNINNVQYDGDGKLICESCLAGSYCPGFHGTFNNKSEGIFACTTPEDTYAWTSDAGAVSQDLCYRTEVIACSDKNTFVPEHAKAISYSVDDITGEQNTTCTIYKDSANITVCSNACVIEDFGCEEGYMIKTEENGSKQCVVEGITCPAGQYLPRGEKQCATCPGNHYYCPGTPQGELLFKDDTKDQGLAECKEDYWFAPRGADSEFSCGRKLHIGDEVLIMRRNEKTKPSLIVEVDGVKYYGDATPVTGEEADKVTINPDTERVLRVKIPVTSENGETEEREYYIHETKYLN